MGLTIQLLGRPGIEGGTPPRGRKAWALLAYLLSAEGSPTREQLAGLLFEDADDPLRALRWNLSELRKALPGAALSKEPLRLDLPPGTVVDLAVLKSGGWPEAIELPGLGRELLEGVGFSSAPIMEMWLLNERRQVKGATEAVLREAVMGLLGLDRAGRAVELATKLATLDPFDESYQALLIQSLVMSGDQAEAEQQFKVFASLLQRELGVEPGPAVRAALTPAVERHGTAVRIDPASIEARIESGTSAVRAGRLDIGLASLKQAAAAAEAVGDKRLRAQALLGAGSALVHTDRSRHEEGSSLLHQVIALADEIADLSMKSSAHRELAWVEFMAARYDRARRWIYKAPAEALEDASTRAGALWVLGKCAIETGHYEESFELLESAVAQAKNAQEPMSLTYCLTAIGRGHLLRRDLDAAARNLEEAISVVKFAGMARFAAYPEAFLAEVRLLQRDPEAARVLVEHSHAAAKEVGDSSMESLALRSRALLALWDDDADAALDALKAARTRMIEAPDHTWSQAYVLDGLCEVAVKRRVPEAAGWVEELLNLSARTGMKEMLGRAYLHRARLGDRAALDSAALVAHEVDNPQLHLMIKAVELEEGISAPA